MSKIQSYWESGDYENFYNELEKFAKYIIGKHGIFVNDFDELIDYIKCYITIKVKGGEYEKFRSSLDFRSYIYTNIRGCISIYRNKERHYSSSIDELVNSGFQVVDDIGSNKFDIIVWDRLEREFGYDRVSKVYEYLMYGRVLIDLSWIRLILWEALWML